MYFTTEHVTPCRVLNEDDDFLTMEVAKRDDVTFSFQRDENNQIVGGDRFYTILFVRFEDGEPVIWKPWEDG
jgi:hypothetical protein